VSPAALNDAGKFDVTWLSDTENNELPESLMLKMFPIFPDDPIPITIRSPVALVVAVGLQSTLIKFPVVSAVEVDPMYNPFPLVKLLRFMFKAIPVVILFEVKLNEFVVVPVSTSSNNDPGSVVPIPTLPLINTAEVVLFPATCSFAAGDVVPTPIFPVDPANSRLNPPSERVVFCVNVPPSVTVLEVEVKPFVKDKLVPPPIQSVQPPFW
jgi:hypothetical protein